MLILVGGFALISIIYNFQCFAKTLNNEFQKILFGLIGATMVLLLNYVLRFIIRIFAKYEFHTSFTNTDTKVADRLQFMLFMNTGVMPFFLFVALKYRVDQTILLSNILFVFLGNAITTPLANYFDIVHVIKTATRFYQSRQPVPFAKWTQS